MDGVRRSSAIPGGPEAHNRSGAALPDAPAGVPDSFSEHMKLLFDLQVLALQTIVTRVIVQDRTRRETASSRRAIDPAVPPASHHGNRERRSWSSARSAVRVGRVAYLLEKMQGDGRRREPLDVDMIWGSPMADPNIHNHRRCPLALFGHANGAPRRRCLKAEDGRMANVMLSAMQKLGMDDVKTSATAPGLRALRRIG
jgi:hypothetical protein